MPSKKINFAPNTSPESQKEIQSHLRVFILECFARQLFSHDDAVAHINGVGYGVTISEDTIKKWYHRFEQGDFSLDDQPRPGRPPLIDDDTLTELFQDTIIHDPTITWGELKKIGHCGFYRAKHIVTGRLKFKQKKL